MHSVLNCVGCTKHLRALANKLSYLCPCCVTRLCELDVFHGVYRTYLWPCVNCKCDVFSTVALISFYLIAGIFHIYSNYELKPIDLYD